MATAVAVMAALLCFKSSHSADENNSLVVGTSVVLSGANSRTGQEQLRGLELWVEEVNARGGLLGRKVALVHYDDTGDPEASARFFEKLIVEDKAAALIGPYSLEATLAAAAVAEKHGVPMVAPGLITKAAWGRTHKNVFALYAPVNSYMDSVLAFAKSKGLRRVGLAYQNSGFPREMADSARARTTALGMRIVFEQEYDKDTTDFSGVIGGLKLKRPDVILVGSHLPDSIAFVRQMKEAKLAPRIAAFATGPGLPEFATQLGADAEGAMGGTPWEPTAKIARAAEFTGKYKMKYRIEPGYQAAGGYAAGQLLEAAVKRAGSAEAERLRKALSEIDTVTVLGRYKVDSAGWQIGQSGFVVQWINGERVPVLPREVSTQEVAYPFKMWSKR